MNDRERRDTVTKRVASGTLLARRLPGLGLFQEGRAARASRVVGATIGRYTILGMVGRGGMGEVYAAYDPGLDRRVALKLMHAEGEAQDPNAEERLWREAQSIAKLSHPNVVVVHDVGMFEEQVFVAMEFVEGATLAAWLAERPRTWREIVGVFQQAAQGLSAAHRAGLVHRDFKPQNVMVTSDGVARVMDFGLARRIDQEAADQLVVAGERLPLGTPAERSLTRTGEQLGTPLYMAPEQFGAGPLDARTDQFSFCVALYAALYKAHPFGGGIPGVARNGAGEREAEPPPRSAVPPWVQQVVLRGLRTDPAARWPSMDALVAALTRDPKRRWRGAMLAAGVLAASALIATWGVTAARRGQAFCEGGPARMAGVWELTGAAGSHARREAVQAAIFRAGGARALTTWERVALLLDKHATQWLRAYREACEATRVHGEQSEDVLDLRMACLGDDLDSTRALTQLLAAGNPGVIENAVGAGAALGDLSRCADVKNLRMGVQLPKDPGIRREVEQLRGRLKEGEALAEAGQYASAGEVAQAVLERATVLDDCPLRSEAMTSKGGSQVRTDIDGAIPILEQAVMLAEGCGHDRMVARAAIGLLSANWYRDWRAAERWAELARAALKRVGGDRRLESWLHNDLAGLRWAQRRIPEGRREIEESLRIKVGLLGMDHPDVAVAETNVAIILAAEGRFEEALAQNDHGMELQDHWMPPDALDQGMSWDGRGTILLGLRRLDEAETSFRRALAIFAVKMSPNNPQVSGPVAGLAQIALLRGQFKEAVALAERALSMREASDDTAFLVAETRFVLARALDGGGIDRARARAAAQRALETFVSDPNFQPQRQEVEDWLAARPLRTAPSPAGRGRAQR